MITYFSTFISGLGEFVAEQLKKDLDSVEINLLLDGLVVYQSDSPIEKIKILRYLNNSFQLIKQHNNLDETRPIETMVDDFVRGKLIIPPGKGKTFRVMFYNANSPVGIDKKLHDKVEERILDTAQSPPWLRQASRMMGRRLIIDRTNPDFEYWFLYRQEGCGFFGLRLTKRPDYKDVLEKGQLRPELANILVLLSDPQKDDIVLDPFAGSGAIPLERAKYPYQKIIAGDINPNFNINWHSHSNTDTSMYRSKQAQNRQNSVQVRIMNALEMKGIVDNSIDKIITDPPWGMFQKGLDIQTFFTQFIREATRVLKSGGTMILLVGRDVDMEKILEQFNGKIELVKSYNILVSGKKAGVFVLKKLAI